VGGPNLPTLDVIEASKLPYTVATRYRAMYVHGMHLRMRPAKLSKTTCDSRVACAVWRRSRSSEAREAGQVEGMEYVDWIEEILKLDYRSHCCIVLFCSWIPAKLVASNTKMVQDKYGFAVGDFKRTMSPGPDSFAFPMQFWQVYFSDDRNFNVARGGDWKIILGTDVRGQHSDTQPTSRPGIQVLAAGKDNDFPELRI
jgi:hypothetical protein